MSTSRITRIKVTWIKTAGRITHPWVYTYTDGEGVERCFDTKAEAVEDQEMRASWEEMKA